MRVSVIVPAYNAATYLTQCYDSVRAQSVSDWEMLIVENGSTDDTVAVGERLAQQDSRVRLLHSEKGVCRARNLGIDEAHGEFVTFLDADDRLLPDAFEVFLRAMTAHPACDIVIGSADVSKAFEGEQMDKALATFLRQPTRYLTVWGKLYRAEFLQNSAVRFNLALTHAEDSEYLIRLLTDCRGLVLTDKAVYCYNTGNTSAVRGQAGTLANKYYIALETIAQHIATQNEDIKQAFCFTVLDNLLVVLVHDIFCSAKSARAQRKDAAELLDKPLFANALAHAPLSQAPIVKRLAYIAAKKKHLLLLQIIVRVRQWQKRRNR